MNDKGIARSREIDKRVFSAFENLINTGVCTLITDRICAETNISPTTINNSLVRLRSKGMITWEKKGGSIGGGRGRHNLYKIVDSSQAPVSESEDFNEVFERWNEIHNIFTGYTTRLSIKALANEKTWKLLLQALDAGILITTEREMINCPIVRLLFPYARYDWCAQWDAVRDHDFIRDRIIPLATIHRKAILARPKEVETILKDELRKLSPRQLKPVRIIIPLQPLEETIIMFGAQVWPPMEERLYNYKELRSAIWIFLDINRHLRAAWGEDAVSRALNIRNIMQGWHHFAVHEMNGTGQPIKNVYSAISELSRLMEKNPEGKNEYPPSPKVEGMW